jgi:RNA ligase (TIGR02306 family)
VKRKLASVQRVLEIVPIAGADAIEAAKINGWQCVVKKGTFAAGDRGVFFEIDSIPPDAPAFRFLWTAKGASPVGGPAEGTRPPKFRIRTMTLRGCLSQGLLLPLAEAGAPADAPDGTDLTELLAVGKYEPPMPPGADDLRAPFPACVPRTDEMRLQSAPAVLDELRGRPYVVTLKYDGTSATYLIDPDDGTFHACGRNWSIREGDSVYWTVARRLGLEAALRAHGGRYAVQGELCGPGIQKNPLALGETRLFVFSVYDLTEHRFLADDEMRALATGMGLVPVAVVEEGEAFAHDQASLLALAEGVYPGTKNQREGIVIRPKAETASATLAGRLSFKAISNKYLLGERD